MQYQKQTTYEERNFYSAVEKLDDNYELLAFVFRDLGLKSKRSDILRKLNYLKFNKPREQNEYYLEFEPYLDRINLMSINELRNYKTKISELQEEFQDKLDFTYEDKKLKEITQEFIVIGFTEKQCRLIAFRELALEERYEKKLARLNKQLRTLKSEKNIIGVQGVLFE